jgi:hypothetical protein
MRTLRQCLFDCDLTLLRVIAAQWGIELPTNRHEDAVDVLTPHLTDPAMQADLWSALPDNERRAMSSLMSAGGSMPTGTFTRRFGQVRPIGPGRLERERPWESPVGTAESLWYRGLIFKSFDQGPGGMQEVVFVPQELQDMIEASEMSQECIAPVQAPSAQKHAGAQMSDDLCSLLAYVHAGQVNAAPGAALPEDHARTFVPQLRDRDSIRLDLLMHLAAQLSLVKPDTIPLRPDPQTATVWLQSSTLQQQRALFEGWRDSAIWNDLWRVPTLRCEDTGSWRNDPLAVRRTALDLLAKLEPGAWHRVEDWVAAIHETSPDFQRPGGDYATWYIRDVATNQYLKGFESWDQVEGALLRFILTGPLYWLGLVDVAVEGTVFCVTEPGHWALGIGHAPTLDKGTIFVVQADGQVQVSASRRYDRFQLARVAEWVASGETYTYRITPSSLERAKAQRITPERIIEFLQRTSESPVPESLAGALRRWGTRGTEAWAQQAVVLRVARPELLDQLTELPRMRKYIRETVSSTMALVALRDWPELLNALLEMGILPELAVESSGEN